MSTWYVNADGVDSDGLTPATGYLTPWDLNQAHSGDMTVGDIVEIVGGGSTIRPNNPVQHGCLFTPDGTIWRSYGTDGTDRLTNRPVINLDNSGIGVFLGKSLLIQNLIFIRNNAANPFVTVNSSDSGSIVEGCKFTNNTPSIFISRAKNLTFRNNIVDGATTGFSIAGTSDDSANAIIVNNVFMNCTSPAIQAYNSTSIKVYNNIAFSSYVDEDNPGGLSTINVNPGIGGLEDYNCANFNGSWQNVNSITEVDPLLNVDYTLQVGSPCIGTGVGPGANANVPTDSFSGVVRSGSTTDMGAMQTVFVVAPVAAFSGTSTSGTIPLSITFTDATTNIPTAWDWDFGDGTIHSTIQNPSHDYTVAGTYTVVLSATNAGGSDSETKTNYITASVPLPVAAFTANITSGSNPLIVYFTDLTSGAPTSWDWNFGDSKYHSYEQNTNRIYSTSGNYTVTLIATNAAGSSSATNINYIYVSGSNTLNTNETYAIEHYSTTAVNSVSGIPDPLSAVPNSFDFSATFNDDVKQFFYYKNFYLPD